MCFDSVFKRKVWLFHAWINKSTSCVLSLNNCLYRSQACLSQSVPTVDKGCIEPFSVSYILLGMIRWEIVYFPMLLSISAVCFRYCQQSCASFCCSQSCSANNGHIDMYWKYPPFMSNFVWFLFQCLHSAQCRLWTS